MTEIKRLERMLQLAKIPFKTGQEYDTVYLAYPEEYTSACACYAWQHKDGLAVGENLLFISGLLTDEEREEWDAVYPFTAGEVFARIAKHWARLIQRRTVTDEDLEKGIAGIVAAVNDAIR